MCKYAVYSLLAGLPRRTMDDEVPSESYIATFFRLGLDTYWVDVIRL